MCMPLGPLLSVIQLGPLAVVKRDKGKPIQRITQMFITSKTKLNHTTLATGLGQRHCSRFGLKVAKRCPATLGIAELSPDRRHQGSAFSARQRLSNLSGRARGEKTLDLAVVSLDGLNRSSELVDENLDQLGFGSDHMVGHLKLRLAKLLPQLLIALLAQMMLLCGKALELLRFERLQMGRGRMTCQKIQSQFCLDVLKGFQRPNIILFERDGELIEKACLVAPHPALIPTQHLKLLGFIGARSQRFQVRLIGSHKLRQYISIKGI